jgi:uncharacterized protein (TIGR02145 family)
MRKILLFSVPFLVLNFQSCNQEDIVPNPPSTPSIVATTGGGVTFDGYTYSTVVYGNGQEWMSENLRSKVYANGDPIAHYSEVEWSTFDSGIWVHQNNDSLNDNPYGKLYNWYAVEDSRNVCPTGWHVPTDEEWTELTNYLGNDNPTYFSFEIAGGKMKSTGTQYWQSPNTDATNESLFSGLPGGRCNNAGDFSDTGFQGWWWSSSPIGSHSAYGRLLKHNQSDISRVSHDKEEGFSIRCLKD